MSDANLRETLINTAKKLDADIVGFAPVSRFAPDDNIFKIYPGVKTVVGLLFRVLRGSLRGVEEGTTYYQYSTMGVENLEETVMPLAMLRLCDALEDAGFDALPQRRHQTVMEPENDTNPEVDFRDIKRGVKNEPQLDFLAAAVRCGLGTPSRTGALLSREFGPFQRYCFILTDAELAPTPLYGEELCDGCGLCEAACPGHAVGADGPDHWQCAVYYNGARGAKNPFMPPSAFEDFPNRAEIISGKADFDRESAEETLKTMYFYPPVKHFYRACLCGRACDRACYIHLEETGKLTRSFNTKFRKRPDWRLSEDNFNI